MTAGWPLPQAQQFYAEMARRLSALMILLETMPLTEMKAVNERLRGTGVLSLPSGISADQARQWQASLRREHDLFDMLLKAVAQAKGQ